MSVFAIILIDVRCLSLFVGETISMYSRVFLRNITAGKSAEKKSCIDDGFFPFCTWYRRGMVLCRGVALETDIEEEDYFGGRCTFEAIRICCGSS